MASTPAAGATVGEYVAPFDRPKLAKAEEESVPIAKEAVAQLLTAFRAFDACNVGPMTGALDRLRRLSSCSNTEQDAAADMVGNIMDFLFSSSKTSWALTLIKNE
eukprot:gene20181-26812_t